MTVEELVAYITEQRDEWQKMTAQRIERLAIIVENPNLQWAINRDDSAQIAEYRSIVAVLDEILDRAKERET